MAHSRTVAPTSIALLAVIAAAGHVLAASSESTLSDAGNWASIAAAVFAFLILAAGAARWTRRVVAERRASRDLPVDWGRLDYVPEANKAAAGHGEALERIRTEMGNTIAVLQKNSNMESQAQADETAAAADRLSETYERSLPAIEENGIVLRACTKGLLKDELPSHVRDIEALSVLREQTHEAHGATAGYFRSLRDAKKITKEQRKKNFSRSLNESMSRLQEQQKAAARAVRGVARGLKASERQMGRRLVWYRVLCHLPWPSMIPRPHFIPRIERGGETDA